MNLLQLAQVDDHEQTFPAQQVWSQFRVRHLCVAGVAILQCRLPLSDRFADRGRSFTRTGPIGMKLVKIFESIQGLGITTWKLPLQPQRAWTANGGIYLTGFTDRIDARCKRKHAPQAAVMVRTYDR